MICKYIYAIVILLLPFQILSAHGDKSENASEFNPLKKGNFHVGFSLNGNTKNQSDVSNLLYTIIDNKSGSIRTNAIAGYFINDDMSIGINYEFKRVKNELNYSTSANDTTLSRKIKLKNTLLAFMRNYVSVGIKKVVFFNDTKFGVGFSTGLSRDESNDGVISKKYDKGTSLILGISPGVMIFLTPNFAFETSIDFLGLEYSRSKIKRDENEYGTSDILDFNFEISLLNLGFGLSYYF